MLQIVYSPQWFYGKDIIIDVVCIIILSLIGIFSLKSFKLNKNKNYLFLALSFFMIGLAYVFKILTNFTIYYHVLETKNFNFGTLTYQAVESSDILFVVGFLMYRLLTLLGLYLLLCIYEKPSRLSMIVVIYLIIVSTYFTHSAYFMFHISALIILAAITWELRINCAKNKHITSRLLFISFIIITISHVISIFAIVSSWVYVAAEIIQLGGFTILLIMFIMVLMHAKKKNKN